jgi:transposase
MNPVEECWRQLKASLKNRFYEDLPELKTAIRRGLNGICTPDTSNYL